MRRRDLLAAGLAALASGAACAADAVPDQWDGQTDVIVVGGGVAGLSAALSAAEHGASVMLLEKNPNVGGDSLRAAGYFNAVDPGRQKRQGILDSIELFYEHIMASGGGRNSPEVARVLAEKAGETLQWLESHGLRVLPTVGALYGNSFPRAHRTALPRGQEFIRVLSAACLAKKVRILTGAQAEELFYRDLPQGREALGVRFRSGSGLHTLFARRGVVLASGGFGANRELLRRYAGAIAELPTDAQPGSTGEMTLAAARAGVALANMDLVEEVPGAREGLRDPVRLDYEPGRVIYVDANGERFVNEEGTRTEIAQAVLAKGERCWSVADSSTVASFDALSQKYLYKGLYAGRAFRAATVGELARQIGLPPGKLEETVRSVRGRRKLDAPPFWAVPVHLRIHVTLGGVVIDPQARCLDGKGQVYGRLFAAGGMTGNVHGANRLGGNGLNTAAVFGRIAGVRAAALPVTQP